MRLRLQKRMVQRGMLPCGLSFRHGLAGSVFVAAMFEYSFVNELYVTCFAFPTKETNFKVETRGIMFTLTLSLALNLSLNSLHELLLQFDIRVLPMSCFALALNLDIACSKNLLSGNRLAVNDFANVYAIAELSFITSPI